LLHFLVMSLLVHSLYSSVMCYWSHSLPFYVYIRVNLIREATGILQILSDQLESFSMHCSDKSIKFLPRSKPERISLNP